MLGNNGLNVTSVLSERCFPEPQETLLSTSAPSLSCQTPLPQVHHTHKPTYTFIIVLLYSKFFYILTCWSLFSHFLFVFPGTGSFRPIHTRLTPSRPLVSKASPAVPSSVTANQLSSMHWFYFTQHYLQQSVWFYYLYVLQNCHITPLYAHCSCSGAIDLAAKSAGIIPGSPCRELDSPTVASDTLLTSTPTADVEPASQLLQHNVPEVRSNAHTLSHFGTL